MARSSGEDSKLCTTNEEEISEAIPDCVNHTANDVDLSSIDEKTENRNNVNKKSGASSKERKKRYITALEKAVQNLRTQSTSLSAQLNLLEEDTNNLSLKNTELKLRMRSMEDEVRLQDARNEVLRKEIQDLRAMVRQSIENEAPTMSFHWSYNQQPNQFQQQKQEVKDLDVGAPLPSPSHSPNISPSKDNTTVLYNDCRLF